MSWKWNTSRSGSPQYVATRVAQKGEARCQNGPVDGEGKQKSISPVLM